MKKILSIMLCLCAVMAVQAQVIKKGDSFWNGKVLYTVVEIRLGTIVYMQGIDESGNNDYELTLEKVGKKAGIYKLIPSRQADESPFRCPWNSRVTYINRSGMKFLAFNNANNLTVETMVLTPDNVTNCQAQHEDALKLPLSKLASNYLMNEEITTTLSTEDMKKYVKKFSHKKHRTVIEDSNMQLMKSELQERENRR